MYSFVAMFEVRCICVVENVLTTCCEGPLVAISLYRYVYRLCRAGSGFCPVFDSGQNNAIDSIYVACKLICSMSRHTVYKLPVLTK
jgi:hypothetical protein